MKEVYIVADNIVSPLGDTTAENFYRLTKGDSGIAPHFDETLSHTAFYASLFSKDGLFITNQAAPFFTKFELLLQASISKALQNTDITLNDKKTILIISSTKGNIGLLENEPFSPALKDRMALHTSANLLAKYFKCINTPLVVSNACISGLLALIVGRRLLQSGQYDHAIIAGADVVSKFILSGFQSFNAISAEQCRPFDKDRKGINLGEGAATIILSADKNLSNGIVMSGGAVSNDANHISGPSRTGQELNFAIQNALAQASLTAVDIDFISAHGTATLYNDEMEALAINLAKLQAVPVNSLKGYYGHTLGAAGLIESAILLQSMQKNIAIPSIGFSQSGVSKVVNVCTALQPTIINNGLKTASGFGGCNAAILFCKN
jgi:3-oxoacyl-[acyl-carrier-protein] synthase I